MRTYKLMFSTGVCWIPAITPDDARNLGKGLESSQFGQFFGAVETALSNNLHFQFVNREQVEN